MHVETEHIDTSKAPKYIWRDDPAIPLSQFPISAGIYGLFAILAFILQEFCIAGIAGYTQLYATIGKYSGVEDRFIWALYYKDLKDVTAIRMFFDKVMLLLLKLTDVTTMILWQAMIDRIAEHLYGIRFLGIVKYMLNASAVVWKGNTLIRW